MLFRSSCPSPNSSYPFWLLVLTFRSSRPAFCGRLTSPVSNMNDPFLWDEWTPPPELDGTRYAARRISFSKNAALRNGFFVCPACGYPTLRLRQQYEQCPLCAWNDDMQDEPYAHINYGGPNDSSLEVARQNFNETLCVWSKNERSEFSDYTYFELFSNEILKHKIELIDLYDSLITADSQNSIDLIWNKINKKLSNRPKNPYK